MPEKIKHTVSAPGKVILHGEHSVVYGKMALACSLNQRTYVTISPSEENFILNLPSLNLKKQYSSKSIMNELFQPIPLLDDSNTFNWQTPEAIDHDKLIKLIQNFIENQDPQLPYSTKMAHTAILFLYVGLLSNFQLNQLDPIEIHVTTELKLSSGSGSSASFCVALTGALIQLIKFDYLSKNLIKTGFKSFDVYNYNMGNFNDLEIDVISRWALAAEKIMHGNPSGIDTSVCSFGSFIEFKKNTPIKPIKIDQQLRIMLVDTNTPRDTKKLVQAVADLRLRHPSTVDHIFDAMDNISYEALESIIKINDSNKLSKETQTESINYQYTILKELFALNHGLLRTLGVSHPTLETICNIISNYNLAGKLTGAGGGGYAIVIIPPDFSSENENKLKADLLNVGFDALITCIGSAGVKVEK